MTDLSPLLSPRSIAIVGASERGHHGKQALDALQTLGWDRPVYLVNPSRNEVWGRPCYPSVADTPTTAELAIVVVGRERVLGVAERCARAGVRALVVNTDGFGESADSVGPQLQRELAALVRETGLLLCGPNCLGIVNRHASVAAYCGPLRAPVLPGNLSFVSQSGGNCSSFMELAHSRNIGMSYVISSGNEACLDLCDYLEHVLDDRHTSAICLFLESIRNPGRFLGLATRALEQGKPIVCVKIGKSATARAAALAHTGALVGSDDAFQALIERAGIARASSLDEAIDRCTLFCLLPRALWPRAGRLAVLTVGGGLAGLVSDLAPGHGLELPALPASVSAVLAGDVAQTVHLRNPFDVPGVQIRESPRIAAGYIDACLESDRYDAALVLKSIPGPASLDYLQGVSGIPTRRGKPVIVSPPVELPLRDYERALMQRSDVVLVTGPVRTMKALEAAVGFRQARSGGRHAGDPSPPEPLPDDIRSELVEQVRAGRSVLDHQTTCRLLAHYGLPIVPQHVVWNESDALQRAQELGYPVVAKLVTSEKTVHKTELGGVITGLETRADLAAALGELREIARRHGLATPAGIPLLLQKAVEPALEMYLGAIVPSGGYPPMVVVGAGGILVETLRDVARAIVPLTVADARTLIERLSVHRVLSGARGKHPYDVAALAQAMVKLADLVAAARDLVAEIDLNPILLREAGSGGFVVDAVVTLRDEP